jgi:hypothetical protein
MKFNEYYTITEALNIVKKASFVSLNPYESFEVHGYKIIPTYHIKDERKGEGKLRDIEVSKSDIIKLINKALNNGLKELNKCYIHLIYKNNGKYDDYIVYKNNRTITITTVLIQHRNKPNYFIKTGDEKLILERYLKDINIIELYIED